MISVLILTRNEELDIAGCIESVAWSDDVHVFDSCSTDRTVEIARALGAHVAQRAFDGYASQRNAALRSTAFNHDWVLILDADERVPGALAEEMRQFVEDAPTDVAACRMRRRDYLFGTWLRHAQLSPFFVRLVRPGMVEYQREINEVLHAKGKIRDLREPFDHFPFSKGIAHWLDKHNRYSSMEAAIALATRKGEVPFSIQRALFASDFNERRQHQKSLFYRLPARPLLKLVYMLFVRGAVLDGRAGLTYTLLQAIYEYMIVVKTRELEQTIVAP